MRLAALTLVALIVGISAVAASACHAVVTMSETCSGLVSYTVTAWNGSPRSNDAVTVQANGVLIATGQFRSSNGYTFSGTYQAPSNAAVTITVTGVGQWYDTGKKSVTDTTKTSAQATRPANCGTAPTTTTPAVTTTTTPVPTLTAPTATTPVVTTPAVTTPVVTTPMVTTTPVITTPVSAPPTVTNPSPPVVVKPVEHPALSLRKTERFDGSSPYVRWLRAVRGTTVHYRMVVTNTGDVSLTVALADQGCDGGTLVGDSPRTLAAGASAEYTCSRVLASSDSSRVVNIATVSGITSTGTHVGPVASRAIVLLTDVTKALGAQTSISATSSKPITATAKPAIAKASPATFAG